MKGRGPAAWVLRGVRAALRRLRSEEGQEGPEIVRPNPEAVFLFASLRPEARKAFEVFPDEARSWRTLAEMEAARSRVWSGQGRNWDAGVCAGRAQAYRAAAEQLEDVLIESLELWDDYERQVGEDRPG